MCTKPQPQTHPPRPLSTSTAALINGSRQNFRLEHVARYVQAGYTVISIDYRLAPESKLPEIIEDLQDAFRWIYGSGPRLLGIDPQWVGVVGHSAGGYLALMAGCTVQPRLAAIVAFYGYGDIVGDWYGKPDPYYCNNFPAITEAESGSAITGPMCTAPYPGRGKELFYLYCRQNGSWAKAVSGHDPATEPDFFVPYCPLQTVTADYPPTLLLHGDQDTDVPYEQSVLMAVYWRSRMSRRNWSPWRRVRHGFDGDMDDPAVQAAFAKVLAFLDSHTQHSIGGDTMPTKSDTPVWWPPTAPKAPTGAVIASVNYNTEGLIAQLLWSIHRFLGDSVQSVVRTMAPPDGLWSSCSKRCRRRSVSTVNAENRHHGPALSQAISYLAQRQQSQLAGHPWVWLLDSDCLIARADAATAAIDAATAAHAALVGEAYWNQWNDDYRFSGFSLLLDPAQVWRAAIGPIPMMGIQIGRVR
ncbi:MAG: alpha/beta hydrolase [Caldilineaceae bacterium]